MLNKIIRKIKGEQKNDNIIEDAIVEKVIQNKAFPFLVSFPRTGSHWLRMLMELYFEKPSLKLIFFQPYLNSTSFTCYHRHDDDLSVEREHVIYLYREPVATVFSQIKFYNEDPDNIQNIEKWSITYAKHLKKWLIDETFTSEKVIINYDKMRENLDGEFKLICDFFKVAFDAEKLAQVSNEVSKDKLKKKTKHDNRVVNLKSDYAEKRQEFINNHTEKIQKIIFEFEPELSKYFQ